MDVQDYSMAEEINRSYGPAWLASTGDYFDPEYVQSRINRFKARYGKAPDRVVEFKGYLLVGPVPEKGVQDGEN